jgi:hypothetical protein
MAPATWDALAVVSPYSNTTDVERQIVEKYSTYLHETVHWWQSIGTTYGLILSLTQAVKTHISHPFLKRLIATGLARKPLIRLPDQSSCRLTNEQQELLRIILNNWHDLEFNARITLRKSYDQESLNQISESPYFHSVGRALHMSLIATLSVLGSTFDRDLRFLPDSRQWDAAFMDLERCQVDGFYGGSETILVEIGAHDIFEAQARFTQIQYLFLASEEQRSWNEFGSMGLLSAEYTGAFRYYLKRTGAEWPSTPTSPEICLFLLLCDLALNPADGYPFGIPHPESFIATNDPGARFVLLCAEVASRPGLLKAIRRCSRQEYLDISMLLCESIGCRTPVEICAEIVRWSALSDDLEALLLEDETFSFAYDNLLIRVCYAKHLRFLEDKLDKPHFYCWPATFLVECWNEFDVDAVTRFLIPHLPLFVASGDKEVKLAFGERRLNKPEVETFNNFYRWIIQYDLTNQWVSREGPFDLDFSEIDPELAPEKVIGFAARDFFDMWGLRPEHVYS